MRIRVVLGVAALALGVLGVPAAVAAPVPAANTSTAGSYTPLSVPTRVLDTRFATGVPTRTPVPAKSSVAFTVAGKGSPAVPAGASAVVLNLTVTGASTGGPITAYADAGPDSSPPGVSNLNAVAGRSVANLAVVPVGSDGKVRMYNGTTGTAHLLADLSGFYSGGQPIPSQQGAFGTLTPVRVLDTRKPTGVPTATPVKAHSAVSFKVEGQSGIPTGLSAVAVNITATRGTTTGYARAYATGEAPPSTSNLNWAAGQTVASLAVVRTGTDGGVTLYNGSSGTVDLIADVQGYWTAGDPVTAGATAALPPVRVMNPRTIAPKGTLSVGLAGLGGLPKANVTTDVLAVGAVGGSASGVITVYGQSSRPSVSTLNYAKGQTVAGLVAVAPDAGGAVHVYNSSSGSVQVYFDTQAYVNAPDLGVPATTTSHYVSDLAAISGTGDTSEGCLDGQQAPRLVLLDVGAQTVTPPLSTRTPGVALVFSDPVERVSYSQLVADLDTYLDEFVRCQPAGHTARIAVGTNNEGVFSGTNGYAAPNRGRDWADDVIDPLRLHAGVTVVGAIDLEAGFASTEAQAEQWITGFLGNTTAGLVNNGSADNCPASFGSAADCGPVLDDNHVTKTWTRAQYVRLSYGLGPGRISVLPQIYLTVPDQAAQWANIDATSGGRLTFEGSLTQRGACGCGQTPSQAWAALYHAKATQVSSPNLPVATDLQPN